MQNKALQNLNAWRGTTPNSPCDLPTLVLVEERCRNRGRKLIIIEHDDYAPSYSKNSGCWRERVHRYATFHGILHAPLFLYSEGAEHVLTRLPCFFLLPVLVGLGSAVCRAALARGMQVTSVRCATTPTSRPLRFADDRVSCSSSGTPYTTPKGHSPAWTSKVCVLSQSRLLRVLALLDCVMVLMCIPFCR